MDVFVVRGGRPLRGTLAVSGAKNAALPMMSAALLCRGRTRLQNVPDLVDVCTLRRLLSELGAESTFSPDGTLELNVVDERPVTARYDLVRRMRASVCVLGPLLARRRKAIVSLPGGCNIGHRPIDLHLKGLAALGADLSMQNGSIHARAGQLIGARIDLAGPRGSTVTGTCNVLSAAVLARGTTVIDNAAREPEVTALGEMLLRMGARIEGLGTSQLLIDGVDELHPAESSIPPDRIEAATLLMGAAITRGQVTLTKVRVRDLQTVLNVLDQIGWTVEVRADGGSDTQTVFLSSTAESRLQPVVVDATPYPGFPTDLQAQLTALLCTIPGRSIVRDHVFPERFMHVAELCRMGAAIQQENAAASILGRTHLTAADVTASDLRASAALVLAALAAEGETLIHRIDYIDRGYERLDRKLASLGADVERRTVDDAGLADRPVAPTIPIRKSA